MNHLSNPQPLTETNPSHQTNQTKPPTMRKPKESKFKEEISLMRQVLYEIRYHQRRFTPVLNYIQKSINPELLDNEKLYDDMPYDTSSLLPYILYKTGDYPYDNSNTKHSVSDYTELINKKDSAPFLQWLNKLAFISHNVSFEHYLICEECAYTDGCGLNTKILLKEHGQSIITEALGLYDHIYAFSLNHLLNPQSNG